MKLYSIIPEDQIAINLDAPTYLKAIESLLNMLSAQMDDAQRQEAMGILAHRETEAPTIPDPGVAIPHARIEGLRDPLVAFGISANGIPAPTNSEPPLHFFALLLTPPSRNTFMLQLMSAVTRLLSVDERRNALLKMKTPQRVLNFLKETEVTIKKTLTVDDIMQTQFPTLEPDDPLDNVTELMVRSKFRALPVINADGHLIGEITAGHLIRLALPDYIGIISNQNFLESFDPFENYFVKERKRKVSEVMRLDCQRVKPETSILEVGQILIESGCRQIYICRGQQLIGVIDAPTFINHCLQL